ncbi:DUF6191 domain-containing protein [Nocardia sp. KC 131]|uniref:DUF6191 domain-containing protein n=1 Tax=Nocardia arseniciresistens TaxID=3392119 RepID=UPI00398E58AD
MDLLLQWSIPGWIILLMLVALYEALTRKRRRRRNPVSGTFTDEFTALFYSTKRMELDHRDSISMLRDEQAKGEPPQFGVDLNSRTVVLRPNESPPARPTKSESRLLRKEKAPHLQEQVKGFGGGGGI